MKEYDLVVVGAGPGGTPAAMAAAGFGKRVLLVDKRGEPGGECLFEGCIPSKILENAANRYAMFKEAEGFHVELKSDPHIHWKEVLEEKERILAMRSQGAMKRIEALPNLDFLPGTAMFVDAHTLDVEGERVAFRHAIVATGRAPNVEGLGLEKAGVEYDRHGIRVDAGMQTSQPHIYAVGDCTPGPKFAHWATYQAGIAVHNLYAPSRHEEDISKLAWVLFSDPQVASAGLSEAEAVAKGMEVTVELYDYASDARAQIDHATDGILKFVVEKGTGRVVGVQAVGPEASSLSGEASTIVAHKMKATDILSAIHPHPTYAEAFSNLARTAFFKGMMAMRGGGGRE
ncbi:dihydrolipoyl dehydrogenase family protein [Hydrogenimonas sp.]